MKSWLRTSFALTLIVADVAWSQEEGVAKVYTTLKAKNGDFRGRLKQIAEGTVRIQEEAFAIQRKELVEYYDLLLGRLQTKEKAATALSMAALERFIQRYPDKRELTANAMFTLAEQYFEKAEQQYFDEKDDDRETRFEFSKAISLFESVTQQFDEFRFLDAAYYLLGASYYYEDRPEDALSAWYKLVEKFKNSSLRDEVWFRIGDEEFNQRHFLKARTAYLEIMKNERSSFYDKALYKLAWIDYIDNRFDEAISGFTKVLDFRGSQGEGNERSSVLESESEQYLAISFSDKDLGDFENQFSEEERDQGIADVEAFKKYFADIGHRTYERRVAVALGNVLFRLSKYLGAERAFSYAIAMDPSHPDNPELSRLIIRAFDEAGMPSRANAARETLTRQYAAQSEWEKVNSLRGEKKALANAKQLVREDLLKLALYEHAEARREKTENKPVESIRLFQDATAHYAAYIRLFNDADDIDKILYFLAEASFDAQWYRASAEAFEQVRDWPWDAEYRRQAAINAVFSYYREIEQAQENGDIPKFNLASIKTEDKARFPGPVPSLLTKFVNAVDMLEKKYPDAQEIPSFLFETAGIYYAFGDMTQADLRFKRLVATYPKMDVASLSANLLLEDKLSKGQWGEAAAEAARFKEAKIGGNTSEFQKIELGARFKEAQELYTGAEKSLAEGHFAVAQPQFEKAAERYLALLSDDSKSEHADKMLYNAAMAFELAKQSKQADTTFERLYKEFPKSSLSQTAMLARATRLEQNLELGKAGEAYLRMANFYPNTKEGGDALLNAALLFEALQDFAKAGAAFEEFGLRYPNRAEAGDAYLRAARLYGKARDSKNQTRLLQAFIKKYRNDSVWTPSVVEADVELADLYRNDMQKSKRDTRNVLQKQKDQAYQDALALFKKYPESPKTAYFASKAQFMLLEDEFKQFEDMKIDALSGKKQSQQLTVKTGRLADLKKKYEQIIRVYGESEWTIASLYQLGALYEGLFRALLAAPCPSDVESIDEFACDEYHSLLEDKAFVLEEKALDAFKLAQEKGKKVPDADAWVFKAEGALHQMRPNDYPIPDRPLSKPIVDLSLESKGANTPGSES